MARQGDTMTHLALSQTTFRHQPHPRQPYSSSTSTSSLITTASPTAARKQPPYNQQELLTVNDTTELDWKYLSTTETYTSEYSSVASDEFEEDGAAHNAQVSDASSAGSRVTTVQRSLGARPFLVPSSTTTTTTTGSSATAAFSSSKEADESTDTIKGMRARALDKVNGRKTSSSALNLSSSSGHLPGSNDYNPYRRTTTTSNNNTATTTPSNNNNDASLGRIRSGQESSSSLSTGPGAASNKIKRRSFGASDKSPSLRITTSSNGNTVTATSKASQQPPEAHHTVPSTPPTLFRKRTSDSPSFRTQQQQPQQSQQQQALFTSEDDSEVPGQTVYQDRTRYASEGGMLVSEIKALKARVQELEMERMNRSLSGLSAQSPQLMTPKSMDHPTILPGSDPQQPSISHSEKLQQIIQKHRGSSVSADLSNPLRSPVIASMSDVECSRDSTTRANGAGALMGSGGRLEPSLSITSPARSPLLASSTARQPTTQHVDHLKNALKNYEKWVGGSLSAAGGGATTGSGTNPSFQAISRVVTNAISMNQTIRAWVKADVSLVDSSSMNALQRASDEQIRSLTEFLLGATEAPSRPAAVDRSSNNPTSETESVGGGGSVISRPYSPRLATVTHRFGQGQRLSLGMVANELGASTVTGYDPNPPYPTRPLSSATSEQYEIVGSAATVGSGMTSSGYLSRTNSIASSNLSEPRARSTVANGRQSQGYASDFSYDRQPTLSQGLGLSRNQHHHSQQQQLQQQQQSMGGAFSSRESSPPQEDPRGPVPRRQPSGLLMMNSQPTTNMNSSRTLQSPAGGAGGSVEGSMNGSHTPAGQQLTRRQASVRDIMARYSQGGSGAKSPNMSEYEPGEPHGSVVSQSQDSVHGGGGRPLSTSQYEEGLRSPLFNATRQLVGTLAQDQHYRYRQHQQVRQDDVMSASESSLGAGQARLGGTIRRPLSQQDHHRNMVGSRLTEPVEGRHGSLGVRAGQRYAATGVFSEDEGASDWGVQQQQQQRVVVNPQRALVDSYSARLKQFRGRHEQQLPFHQEGLSFEDPYPDNAQQQQQQQQQYQEEERMYAEGVEVEEGDALTIGPVPRFAQRQPRYQAQSQYLDKPQQHRQALQQHQHHQDMMMSTPSLPSPNSSPSSSARLDAPSLMMSLSNHGQGGGLVAVAASSSSSSSAGGGIGGRYHLSPRGPPVSSSTFSRQESLAGMSALGDDHGGSSYRQELNVRQQQQQQGAGAVRRGVVPLPTLHAAQS
ncbi:hypothetical protein BGX23_002055 [Mortierella sp. AD031]|nr:hypothetical protein BGX23_002055 [Mortierella sp. AD031]